MTVGVNPPRKGETARSEAARRPARGYSERPPGRRRARPLASPALWRRRRRRAAARPGAARSGAERSGPERSGAERSAQRQSPGRGAGGPSLCPVVRRIGRQLLDRGKPCPHSCAGGKPLPPKRQLWAVSHASFLSRHGKKPSFSPVKRSQGVWCGDTPRREQKRALTAPLQATSSNR